MLQAASIIPSTHSFWYITIILKIQRISKGIKPKHTHTDDWWLFHTRMLCTNNTHNIYIYIIYIYISCVAIYNVPQPSALLFPPWLKDWEWKRPRPASTHVQGLEAMGDESYSVHPEFPLKDGLTWDLFWIFQGKKHKVSSFQIGNLRGFSSVTIYSRSFFSSSSHSHDGVLNFKWCEPNDRMLLLMSLLTIRKRMIFEVDLGIISNL